jgi:organic radical activating enzyme
MVVNVVMIETVGRCIASCNYCPQGAGILPPMDLGRSIISDEILDKALKLAQEGNQEVILLHHRGEPFLHPHIEDIIAKVREAGFLACLSTNLIVATEEKLRSALQAGLNQLEVHYSGGRTLLSHDELLRRIHVLRKMNWLIRNNGCRIEVNYALQGDETEVSVRSQMATSCYYDETMCIKFYEPHDWLSLMHKQDHGIDPVSCAWYKTQSCAVLCNGDVVICCLDQWAYSKRVNIMDVDKIEKDFLLERTICRGCDQYDWFTEWLPREILQIPDYLMRKLQVDSLLSDYK